MRNFIKVLLVLFLSVNIYSQTTDTTITELRGTEDREGNTHLFYRIYYRTGNETSYSVNNSIYQYSTLTGKDSLFFPCGYYNYIISGSSSNVEYFDFWHNNLSEFIYAGTSCGMDCESYIRRFDESEPSKIPMPLGLISKINISKQNDSLIFSSNSNLLIRSNDGGRNWNIVDSSAYVNFISLCPFDDNQIFGVNEKYKLIKSIDGGLTFNVVDTASIKTTYSLNIYYDRDSLHIYRIQSYLYKGAKSNLYVSDSRGDSSSWHQVYSSDNAIYASVDYSQSGVVYLSDGPDILVSHDYGKTFDKMETLNKDIVGIYTKPGSGKLFAATSADIFEINSGTVLSLKHLIVGVKKDKGTPQNFILNQNYPNPFNPSTTISYSVPERTFVTLKVYDILGRQVATLVNEEKSAGTFKVEFNSNNRLPTTDHQFSSGVYFYRLRAGNTVLVKKMILLQ